MSKSDPRADLTAWVLREQSLAARPAEMPSVPELRESLKNVPEGLEPVSKLVRALDEADDGSELRLEQRTPRTIEPLIEAMMPQDPPGVPSTALLLQAKRNAGARLELLREFGYLTAEQIAEHRGSRAANRSALAGRWRGEGRVFAVDWHGARLYPGFQFDEQVSPRPVVAKVLRVLPTERMSEWEVALWWAAANGWLSGARPVDLIDEDPSRVVAAASHLADPSAL